MSNGTEVKQRICGCGHRVQDHSETECGAFWRYPDVLTSRPCGCKGVWRPGRSHSQYERWAEQERSA